MIRLFLPAACLLVAVILKGVSYPLLLLLIILKQAISRSRISMLRFKLSE